jgi:hypothetical protein
MTSPRLVVPRHKAFGRSLEASRCVACPASRNTVRARRKGDEQPAARGGDARNRPPETYSSRACGRSASSLPQRSASTFITPLLDALKARPTSVALAGGDRVLLTQVAVGLARRLDPEFHWFDIRSSESEAPRWQSTLEAGIPPERRHTLAVPEMQLDSPGAERGSADARHPPPAPTSPGFLDNLSRIPEGIRRVALENESGPTPRVILMTNVERASAAFDASSGSLRPYIEALNEVGVTVVLTARSRPRENKSDIDLLLAVEGSREDPRDPATVVCEATRSVGLFPMIPPGSAYAADSFVRP